MSKLKVMTIVGTRPEIIRLSRVIPKLDEYFEHTLIHTGQNYDFELNQIFFSDLGVRNPDIYLECAGLTSSQTIANVIEKSDSLLNTYSPDAVLILGDTNSSLAAIPAKRRKIPIFHMEAGNRCFDLRVPEEINRKIVDHISDINLPYSSIARDYLIAEGIKPDSIVKTGSPMDEVINFYKNKILHSNVLSDLGLSENEFFLVSLHREENVDYEFNISRFNLLLNKLAEKYGYPIIVSTHPRTRKKIEQLGMKFNELVRLMKPLSFTDYTRLQLDSKAVLSDSGTITEESSILNFRALNIREAHERPEGSEEGAVMFTGMDVGVIFNALEILENQAKGDVRTISLVQDYHAPNVSEKVARTILSYTGFVNRTVWKKELERSQ